MGRVKGLLCLPRTRLPNDEVGIAARHLLDALMAYFEAGGDADMFADDVSETGSILSSDDSDSEPSSDSE